MDISYGTWNVRSLYRAGSVKTAASELAKLDLVAVGEVRLGNVDSESVDDYTFLYRNRNANHHLGAGFFIHRRIISPIKKVKLTGDKVSDILLGGR
jgi:hypothetical protein